MLFPAIFFLLHEFPFIYFNEKAVFNLIFCIIHEYPDAIRGIHQRNFRMNEHALSLSTLKIIERTTNYMKSNRKP